MSEPDLARIREVWRSVSDQEILRACDNPEDYPQEVYEIVKAVAQSRSLEPGGHLRELSQLARIGRQYASAIQGVLDPYAAKFAGLVLGHRYLAAALFAVGYSKVCIWLSPWIASLPIALWMVVFLAVFISALAIICWPLRTYSSVLLVSTIATCCSVLVRIPLIRQAGVQRLQVLVMAGYAVAVAWIVMSACLVITVLLHNRFWPLVPPGHCRVCRYNLRGLLEPRCPECGTPFDPNDACSGKNES